MAKDNQKIQRAVALRYRTAKDTAPVLVAKGTGRTAERIIELARENDVPVREDRNLVQVLGALKLEEAIPPEAYQAVATILAFLYRINR